MTITDEILSAYIDSELSADEQAAVRAAISKDAALARRLEALKAPDRLIAAAYGDIAEAPMPESVMALLYSGGGPAGEAKRGGGNVLAFPGPRVFRAAAPWGAALAASIALAIGVGVGVELASSPASDGVLLAGPATSALAVALDTTSSGNSFEIADSGARITPVLSFRSVDGAPCREFAVSNGANAQRAVACRDSDGWSVKIAVAVDPAAAPDGYATASSAISAQFDNAVEAMIAGDPMAPADEQEMIARRWRN